MRTTIGQRFARRVLGKRASARVVIVVPLKESSRQRVREILASGPPFDPAGAGLDQHWVVLTDHEVVFVFEAADAAALGHLIADTRVWDAAIAWREYVAGPPRVAEEAYSWTRRRTPEGVSFESTPGPGDSEGGDVYPP
jgi:hypothetical protein